jgi:ElaB/YqjD/DUF883 family membrane-anchored ribosome-binding protein
VLVGEAAIKWVENNTERNEQGLQEALAELEAISEHVRELRSNGPDVQTYVALKEEARNATQRFHGIATQYIPEDQRSTIREDVSPTRAIQTRTQELLDRVNVYNQMQAERLGLNVSDRRGLSKDEAVALLERHQENIQERVEEKKQLLQERLDRAESRLAEARDRVEQRTREGREAALQRIQQRIGEPGSNPGEIIACPQDVRQCPDGTYVTRDPAQNCAFRDCPGSNGYKAPQQAPNSSPQGAR